MFRSNLKDYSETFFGILCSYHQHIESLPMVLCTYEVDDKTGANQIDTTTVYDILKYTYNLPDDQIADLKALIDELKCTQLDHTRTITIFNQSPTDENVWVRLIRNDPKIDTKEKEMVDMYINYDPDNGAFRHLLNIHNNKKGEKIKSKAKSALIATGCVASVVVGLTVAIKKMHIM
jgi:hypothetical protein